MPAACVASRHANVLIDAVDQGAVQVEQRMESGARTVTAQPSSLAFISMVVFNNFEIGQPVFAACVACPMPPDLLHTPFDIEKDVRWPARFKFVQGHRGLRLQFSGVNPALPNCADSAMVKQLARGGNQFLGLVPFRFQRVPKEYCWFVNTPLSLDTVPLPLFKSPCQTADPERFAFSS
jgi:hypothetical protein